MEFPTALLGVAFGTVLLPSLSRAYAAEQADEYSRLLDWGLRLTCLLALAGYAIGLLGLIAVKILAPAFYSRQDMKTPVTIGLASLAVTLAGNAALVPWLAHVGLTVSISLGALANAGLLLWVLRRRGIYRPRADWALFFAKLLLPLAALAALLWFANSRFDWVAMQSTPLLRVAWMSGTIGAAVAVYFGLLFALGFRPRDFLLRTK
jgi:putative peptidoglycan lipid II flippase